MKEVSAEYIEKLVEIMKGNELTEITLEDSDRSLFIKSNGFVPVVKEKEIVEKIEETVIQEEKEEPKKNLVPITSNMIGLYYEKQSGSEVPFVKVGDSIKEGQTICLIETVKIMNKITSDVSGKIVEICIEDGKPVEYGQVIMYVEKN